MYAITRVKGRESMENKLNIEIDLNTSKVEKKLKAISEHANSLVEELKSIDRDCNDDVTTEELIQELSLREDVRMVDPEDGVFRVQVELNDKRTKPFTIIKNNFKQLGRRH
jgi:cell division protein FtsB